MRTLYVGLIGLAIVVVGIGAQRHFAGATAAVRTAPASRAPEDEVQADSASTRESTAVEQLPTLSAKDTTNSAGPSRTSRPPREDLGEHAPEAPSMEDERDFVKSKFVAQTVDPSWAKTAKAEVAEAFTQFGTRESRIRNIECRTSICAVEVDNDDEAAYRKFSMAAFEPGKLKLPNELMVTREDNSWRMVVYLGRQGNPLPMLE